MTSINSSLLMPFCFIEVEGQLVRSIERDEGRHEDHRPDRAKHGVEAALHRGTDPKILVPAHARGELHQMAEA